MSELDVARVNEAMEMMSEGKAMIDAACGKRPRRTAVEAAKARLEAAQKRERDALLKKAHASANQTVELLKLAGKFPIFLEEPDGYSAVDYAVDVAVAIGRELAK